METVKTGLNSSKEPKEKALSLAVAQIERQFGKGAIMRLGAQPSALDIAVIPTGAISLDAALGVGGIPRGRVTEIYGPEASGKTTIALHLIAEAQKAGGIAAFIDAEHALDPVYAQKLGVKTEELLISQPDTGEQALEIAEALVRSGAIDVIAVDSVAALVPRAEIEGEMGDSHPGLQARLLSQALRNLTEAELDQRCLDAALRFLAPRPRSEQEIRRRLGEKGHQPDRVDRVIARLRELQLADDRAFVDFWLENRTLHRPRGARALKV